MPTRFTLRVVPGLLVASLALLLAGGGGLAAQTPSPQQKPCSPGDRSNPACASPPVTPATKTFPYPGETLPPASQPAGKQDSAGQQFPYPGESGAKTGDSSSSSSSSSGSSNADAPDDPLDTPSASPGSGNVVRRKLPKPTHLQSDEEREIEDVKVGRFYLDSGNALGAYSRLKDATRLIQDDPDALYLLGKAAGKMGKIEESNDAFHKFLILEPDTRRARGVRQTLRETQARR